MDAGRSVLLNKILASEPDPAYARRVKVIFENLDLFGTERVLEVGCGRGFYLTTLFALWPKLKIYGIDRNKNFLDVAKRFVGKKPIHLINSDANKLPFPNNYFDRIIASEVLEHIKTDQKAMKEIHRVLKPDGIVMITVPNKKYPFFYDPINWLLEKSLNIHLNKDSWWLAGIWAEHERLYTEEELRKKLKKSNFKIEKSWFLTRHCFPFSHHLFYGVGVMLLGTGLLQSFNRFEEKSSQSFSNKILLWPFRTIDKLNKKKFNSGISVNLAIKAVKP